MTKIKNLRDMLEELDIADIVGQQVTEEQQRVLRRLYDAKKNRSAHGGHGIRTALYLALGIGGPFSLDSLNTHGINTTYENGLATTDEPKTGDVCAWHSNSLLYVMDGFYSSTLRQLGIVVGERDDIIYVAHQMGGVLHIESSKNAAETVDARVRSEFQERYNGVLRVVYHPLDAVVGERKNFLHSVRR